ncbi:MAG: hypothetical protein GY906_11120 [bacterium]|nr:hypothetical protein [bacterium]
MNFSALFSQRPWVKLLEVLAGIVVLILVTVISLAIIGETVRMKRQTRHQGEFLAGTVHASMSESLATGDNEAVVQQFIALRKNAEDVDVFVFDPEGVVSFGTLADSIGDGIDGVTSSDEVSLALARALGGLEVQSSSLEEEVNGSSYVSVVRPILNETRCFECHGSSEKVLGSIMVRSSTEGAVSAIRWARNINIAIGIMGLVVAVVLIRFLLSQIVRELVKDVVSGSEVMALSSAELTRVFEELSTEAQETSSRSESVTVSVQDLASTLTSVAASMEQSSVAVNAISTAAEEMTSSVSEIARECESASVKSQDAVSEAQNASQMIENLGGEAREIGSIIEVINSISGQINLLALNATIEAARAGDAGRGFAVVATEVKDLAQQTAGATDMIREKIERIQGSATRIVSEVEEFSAVVHDVNEIVIAIAAAVDQQAATTSEIASGVTQSSQGVQQVTAELADSSMVLEGIASDMSEVSRVAHVVSGGSLIVNTRAEELAGLAKRLSEVVSRFKL